MCAFLYVIMFIGDYMFKRGYEINRKYTRAIYSGVKLLGSDEVISGISSCIIVNNEGWLLTCKHVAEQIIYSEEIKELFEEYKTIENDKNKLIEFKKKHDLTDEDVISQINIFVDIFKGGYLEKIILDKTLDIALIKWSEFDEISTDHFPIFSSTKVSIGEYVCKLGFAFLEYDYFYYDKIKKEILKIQDKEFDAPLFPLDGMVTRYIRLESTSEVMFELSTPGIKGQSGGSIFNKEGHVIGMQSATRHMDLMFDINGKVKRGTKYQDVDEKQFINLGVGILSKELMRFMDENNIKYNKII